MVKKSLVVKMIKAITLHANSRSFSHGPMSGIPITRILSQWGQHLKHYSGAAHFFNPTPVYSYTSLSFLAGK